MNNLKKSSQKPMKYTVPIGQYSGMLMTVFGTMGSATFGIAILVLILLGALMGKFFYMVATILSPLLAISLIVTIKGVYTSKRLERFQQYTLCLGSKNYCLMDDLSSATRLSNKYIEKDLRKMIKRGMFPEGHIDDQKTMFMLTNSCYKHHLELQAFEMKKLTEKKDLEKEHKQNYKLNPEMKKSLDEGRRFVLDIKKANFAILGEEISLKLDRLEEVTGKIYDYVEIHPEKFNEIKKFTEYFLPTTLKLVDAYRKLDDQTVQGVNISSAKQEIEGSMDTINLAFENLLDDLFQEIAMDISTDISVLETMLAQEGLSDHTMRNKNKKKEGQE